MDNRVWTDLRAAAAPVAGIVKPTRRVHATSANPGSTAVLSYVHIGSLRRRPVCAKPERDDQGHADQQRARRFFPRTIEIFDSSALVQVEDSHNPSFAPRSMAPPV